MLPHQRTQPAERHLADTEFITQFSARMLIAENDPAELKAAYDEYAKLAATPGQLTHLVVDQATRFTQAYDATRDEVHDKRTTGSTRTALTRDARLTVQSLCVAALRLNAFEDDSFVQAIYTTTSSRQPDQRTHEQFILQGHWSDLLGKYLGGTSLAPEGGARVDNDVNRLRELTIDGSGEEAKERALNALIRFYRDGFLDTKSAVAQRKESFWFFHSLGVCRNMPRFLPVMLEAMDRDDVVRAVLGTASETKARYGADAARAYIYELLKAYADNQEERDTDFLKEALRQSVPSSKDRLSFSINKLIQFCDDTIKTLYLEGNDNPDRALPTPVIKGGTEAPPDYSQVQRAISRLLAISVNKNLSIEDKERLYVQDEMHAELIARLIVGTGYNKIEGITRSLAVGHVGALLLLGVVSKAGMQQIGDALRGVPTTGLPNALRTAFGLARSAMPSDPLSP